MKMGLESKIDELYRLALGEFTAARNALAKTLSGDEKEQVRRLAKPTLVPWAVNQLYWHARPVFDKLMKSGAALRNTQIAALNGRAGPKPADVVPASDAHRAALAAAVQQAVRLAAAGGAKPDADEMSRTLESLSLSAAPPDHSGRLTEVVRPAGFEALAGVAPSLINPAPTAAASAPAEAKNVVSAFRRTDAPKRTDEAKRQREAAAEERRREQELAAKRRQAEAEVASAERGFELAKAAEGKAREALDSAEQAREAARTRLSQARKFLTSNF